ncbi:uncharacterized protein LOC134284969 [Aedes albopictus]|uniref:NACHT domain-containing protein n=1 Tax=Aedes albopictus TaxID=7160 RepID=A0ABM2A4G8_AEDAL
MKQKELFIGNRFGWADCCAVQLKFQYLKINQRFRIMKAEKFDPASTSDYISGKNIAEHGNKYQRDLAFMLFVRVALKGYKFKLFTELPEAGKFDDVAVYVEDLNETWLFQSKHTDPTNPGKILTKALVPSDERLLGNDFDLFKYARSYIEVARRIKGNKQYFLFTNKNLDEESIRNSEYLEIIPGKVNEMVDLSSLGGEYRKFRLKIDKSETNNKLIRDANKNFYNLLDAIGNLFSPNATEGNDKNRNKILSDYKTVVRKILVRDGKKMCFSKEFLLANSESPAMKRMKEELSCLLGKNLDTLKCDNVAGLLDAKNSRNTELPEFIGETELKDFFDNFTMCVNQPNVLESAVKNELRLWLRKTVPPHSLGQFTSSQLDQPMYKFDQTFKKWYEPNMVSSPSNMMVSLGSEKAEECIKEILNDFESHISQPGILKQYYVPREIDCENSVRVSDEEFPEWLIKEFHRKNCLVLIAGPGMGKTTFMQHVSFAMQQAYHSTDFYMIYLKELKKKLQEMANDQISLEQALQVFKGSLSEQSCTVIREHTQNTNSRILFFLDGFDEVPSAEHSKMIAVLKQLLSMDRTQLMISGRKHVQQQLKQLSSEIRTVNLVPFSNKDQLDFLQKFWDVSTKNATTMAKFRKFANQLLKTFHFGIKRPQYDVTGVPLMVRMLAEVYIEKVEECLLTDNETDGETYITTTEFSEVKLYERFVEKSFCMKLRKKFYLDAYTTCKDKLDGEFKPIFDEDTLEHQLAAINELNIKELDDIVREKHGNKYENFLKRVENGNDKSLLINTSGKTVRFVHLSFAEYFTAKYLCDYIECCKPVLYHILRKQVGVRKLFFRLIEEMSEEAHTKCLAALGKICEQTPKIIFWACEAVCVNVTKSLNYNAYQNIHIDDYGTILHLAVSVDSFGLLQYLLDDCGTDSYIIPNTEINPMADFVRNKENYNDSHRSAEWIVYHNHAKIVSLLLSHNADVNAESYSKLTALHLAANFGFLEIADILIQTNQINGNAQDEYGRTALHLAACFNYIEIVRLLMNHAAHLKLDLNAVDSDNNTALHLALLENHTEVAKLLIENPSVDINAITKDRIAPLQLAVAHGNSFIVELLKTRNASIDGLNSMNCTPLHIATEKGDPSRRKYRQHYEICYFGVITK